MPLKPSQKSLILALLAVFVNFFSYITFRLFAFKELNLIEGLIFTGYESIIHFVVIFGVSYLFFKRGK